MSPTHHPYLLVMRPEEVNGRLCAHNGRLLLNLLNYTELLLSVPPLSDERLQVFEVEIPVDLVRVQQDGERTVHLLWSGEKHARSRPGELVTVSIRSPVPFVSDATVDPAVVASTAFAGFPQAVQLAVTLLSVDDATLIAAGIAPPVVRTWANGQVQKSTAAAAGA